MLKKRQKSSRIQTDRSNRRAFEPLESRQMMTGNIWSFGGEVDPEPTVSVDAERLVPSIRLEERVKPSSSRSGGTTTQHFLQVSGSHGDDEITIQEVDVAQYSLKRLVWGGFSWNVTYVPKIRATISNRVTDEILAQAHFDLNEFTEMEIRARGGDDEVSNDTGIGSTIFGDDGADILYGGSGTDKLNGGAGNDHLYGRTGNDTLRGDSGGDHLEGGDDRDSLHGGAGSDYLYGQDGPDFLYGDDGIDFLWGGAQRDKLYGGPGYDQLRGDSGNDFLAGEEDSDYLNGGVGNDGYYGGSGADVFDGGGGHDRILINPDLDGTMLESISVSGFQNPVTFINFHDGVESEFDVTYRPGSFTSADVDKIDDQLNMLQEFTGNTRLLKTPTGAPLRFYMHAVSGGDFAAVNDNHGIHLNGTIDNEAILHEFAHFWDEPGENPFMRQFYGISSWIRDDFGILDLSSDGYTRTTDENRNVWWYRGDANDFCSDYAMQDPEEDFAEAFKLYVIDPIGVSHNWNKSAAVRAKFELMDDFFAWLAED